MIKYFLFFFIAFANIFAQAFYTPEDTIICESKFNFALEKKLSALPINNVIVEIGKTFLGLDYEAHTLEMEGDENLVIHLTGLDCTTYLENCITFARCIKQGKTSFEDYQNELIKIRYRDGIINKYPSRLHYFSDWIYHNIKKSIIEDVTIELGGVKLPLALNFMSKNRKLYKQIKDNDEFLKEILNTENEINSRGYFYIPKKNVKSIESKIKNGYLIAITTSIQGLDITHVGIAVKENDGRIHLMHAPIPGEKLQITKKPLAEYLAGNKKHTGIIVLKPLEPAS